MRPFVALSLLVLLSGIALLGAATADTPELVAHRGASHDAPGNTLAAFRLAWEKGADAIEGDFHLTGDGRVVCLHDRTTRKVADRRLVVAESTLDELRQLDVGSWKDPRWKDERIPTLDEVLATVPEGKKILIEIKCGVEIFPPLEKALAGSGLEPGQTTIICFDAAVVAEAKRRLPGRKAYWLTDFTTDRESGALKPSAAEIVKKLEEIGADGVDCEAHPYIDRAFVETLRQAKMEFHVWTLNSIKKAKRFGELGLDSITTDRPGWLRERLAKSKRGRD